MWTMSATAPAEVEVMPPSTAVLQRLGAILDDRGSLGVGSDPGGYQFEQIRLTGPQRELEEFRASFGGSVCRNGRQCPLIWRVTADAARAVLVAVAPHMIRRRQLALALVEFGKVRQENPSNRERIAEAAETIRELAEAA